MEKKKIKTIWLVNKHACPPQYYATHIRTTNLAKQFIKVGYDVRIICSSTIHNSNIEIKTKKKNYIEKEYNGVKYIFIKTIPYHNSKIKRIFSLIQFGFRVFSLRSQIIQPDIIIHTALVPFDYMISNCAKKLHCKYIVEILDLWPESFIQLKLAKKYNIFIKLSYLFERKLYTKADKLVFSMEGGKQYIIDKKWDIDHNGKIDLSKVLYINNGVDISEYTYNKSKYQIRDDDLENDTLKKVIYMGSIRLNNNLNSLLDIARNLKDTHEILFLIYGDGEGREHIEELCKEENLDNIHFKQKWVEPKFVPYILDKAAVNLLHYKNSDISKYGGSQNKLFLSIMSGKPICSNVGMNYSLINKYNLGIDKKFANISEYVSALKKLLNLSEEEKHRISITSSVLIKQFDYSSLAEKYIKILN